MEFPTGMLERLTGIPIYVDKEIHIQRRKHRKRRINKKWQKRYGFFHKEPLFNEDGKVYQIGNTLYMNEKTYKMLHDCVDADKNELRRGD